MKFQAIKGTRDILPPETAEWNRVEQCAREVFERYGYGEIRLPIFEQTELFARSIGQATEIVSKEMYTFEDRPLELPDPSGPISFPDYISQLEVLFRQGRIPVFPANQDAIRRLREEYEKLQEELGPRPPGGWPKEHLLRVGKKIFYVFALARTVKLGESVSLRPEATASVCRAYIEHGLHTRPGNVKLYYIGPMFRRERPQKGRYRQFYQIGAEVLGPSDAPTVDAEVIEMLLHFFARVELAGAQLWVNSIGCRECRSAYVRVLREALIENINELKADSQRRVETNPLRVLDSKVEEEQAVIERLPRISGHLCGACRQHYDELKRQLALRGIEYAENWRLVRGLDYYMRTTFEITAPGLGAQNAVCGGGRYDGLVELLGGPATKGIGFAIGTDRLMLALEAAGKGAAEKKPSVDVFIAWQGAETQRLAVQTARVLREAGWRVEVPAEEMKFRKALGLADKLGARFAVIIGEEEARSGRLTLKHLVDGTQETVAREELVAKLTAARSGK
jgi:histidyl-tRNA synthetase